MFNQSAGLTKDYQIPARADEILYYELNFEWLLDKQLLLETVLYYTTCITAEEAFPDRRGIFLFLIMGFVGRHDCDCKLPQLVASGCFGGFIGIPQNIVALLVEAYVEVWSS